MRVTAICITIFCDESLRAIVNLVHYLKNYSYIIKEKRAALAYFCTLFTLAGEMKYDNMNVKSLLNKEKIIQIKRR